MAKDAKGHTLAVVAKIKECQGVVFVACRSLLSY